MPESPYALPVKSVRERLEGADGSDPFGPGTKHFPWKTANLSEFYTKFHVNSLLCILIIHFYQRDTRT